MVMNQQNNPASDYNFASFYGGAIIVQKPVNSKGAQAVL